MSSFHSRLIGGRQRKGRGSLKHGDSMDRQGRLYCTAWKRPRALFRKGDLILYDRWLPAGGAAVADGSDLILGWLWRSFGDTDLIFPRLSLLLLKDASNRLMAALREGSASRVGDMEAAVITGREKSPSQDAQQQVAPWPPAPGPHHLTQLNFKIERPAGHRGAIFSLLSPVQWQGRVTFRHHCLEIQSH